MLITIDSVGIPGYSPRAKIPPNVRVNYNYYQDSDIFARNTTCHKNYRVGSDDEQGADDKTVQNIEVLMGASISPHVRIDRKVATVMAGQIRLLMMGKLHKLNLPARLDKKLIGDAAYTMEQAFD